MKTLTILFILFIISGSGYAQLEVDADGYIKMRGAHWTDGLQVQDITFAGSQMVSLYPNTAWRGTLGTQSNYFAGAYISHIWASIYDDWPSDGRLKENIKPLSKAIDKIKLLKPVKYDIKESFYGKISKDTKDVVMKDAKNRLGFIAQDIMQVMPEVVHKEPSTGYYGVCTMDLIPVCVQAIKEQQNIIEKQSKEIAALQHELISLKNNCCNKETDNSNTTKSVTNDKEEMPQALLYNNQPNPFSESTEIRYYLPDNINVANLYIYDMNGVQIKSFEITDRGHGQLIIAGTELHAGMYMYSLIADGQVVDTKTMVLTD